jgi:hypothetical protein
MMYVVTAVLIIVIIAIALGVQNLLGPNIRLYVLDVSGAMTEAVNSTVFLFKTPLSGSLTFLSRTEVGNWESRAVTHDTTGKLYVSAWSNYAQQPAEILASPDPPSAFARAISGDVGGFTRPAGLVVDTANNLYVADIGQPEPPSGNSSGVRIFKTGGSVSMPVVIPADNYFSLAGDVAVDGQDNVYVLSIKDPQNIRGGFPQLAVYSLNPDQTHYDRTGPIVGPILGDLGHSWLTDPQQVALDDGGYIYVTDRGPPPKIVIFPPSQPVPPPSGEVNCAQFQFPYGISICKNVIYVADPGARAVLVFSPAQVAPFGSRQMAVPIQTITRADLPFAGPYGVDAVALPWFKRLL